MAVLQPVTTILFDLDDTLYRNEEVPLLMRDNIARAPLLTDRYMREKLDIPAEGLEARNRQFYIDYGTTLAGLRVKGYEVDYEDWHAYVHGTLPYSRLIHDDPQLRGVLTSLPQRKLVFTNADIRHAEKVLSRLGIRDAFEGVISFESIMKAADSKGLLSAQRPVICKPSPEAFRLALEQAGAAPETTLFLDDSARNVAGASEAGLRAVLVGSAGVGGPAIAEIPTVADLPRALPELWSARATVLTSPRFALQPAAPEVGVVAR